jgi:hypothetical protein
VAQRIEDGLVVIMVKNCEDITRYLLIFNTFNMLPKFLENESVRQRAEEMVRPSPEPKSGFDLDRRIVRASTLHQPSTRHVQCCDCIDPQTSNKLRRDGSFRDTSV